MAKLSSYHLKLIAALTMLLDHAGAILYPETDWLRTVGRISFPLFLWLLIQGEKHTRDVWRYGLRLGLLGLLSQPIYQFAFDTTQLNVLFHLLVGLACLHVTRKQPELTWIVWISAALGTEILNISYGSYGIVLLVLFRYFQPSSLWWLVWIGVNLLYVIPFGTFQLPVIVVPLLFLLFNGQRGPQIRWFYGFYPGHIAALAGLHRWLQLGQPTFF